MPKPSEDGLNREKPMPEEENAKHADTPSLLSPGKAETAGAAAVKQNSPAVVKPQLLRVATVVKNHKIDSVTAAAVMTAHRLKSGNRIEPAKFLKMVESFRQRKIKRSGGGR